jgi:hypothetical protein
MMDGNMLSSSDMPVVEQPRATEQPLVVVMISIVIYLALFVLTSYKLQAEFWIS